TLGNLHELRHYADVWLLTLLLLSLQKHLASREITISDIMATHEQRCCRYSAAGNAPHRDLAVGYWHKSKYKQARCSVTLGGGVSWPQESDAFEGAFSGTLDKSIFVGSWRSQVLKVWYGTRQALRSGSLAWPCTTAFNGKVETLEMRQERRIQQRGRGEGSTLAFRRGRRVGTSHMAAQRTLERDRSHTMQC
ncbi:hypothetical protein D6C93_00833, partial [Aureobasidium pullulans]